MLTEILGVVEKTNTRPLLLAFLTLALATTPPNDDLLLDPLSPRLLLVPLLAAMAYVAIWLWEAFVIRLNAGLSSNDIASWGPMIGSTILATCFLFTFSFLATRPNELSLALLGKPGFVWLCTLYLLAAETIKIRR